MLRGAMAGLALLPRTWAAALGRAVGLALARSERRVAQVTRRNLALALPQLHDEAREELLRASLTHTAALVAEMGFVWHAPPAIVLSRLASVTGEELLETEGGCLVLGCHLGNWEWLNLWLASRARGHGAPFLALFDPQGPAEVVAWVRQQRQRNGARLLPLNAGGLRAALVTLRHRGRVGLLVDQVPQPLSGVHVPFFRQPALTMTLAQQLLRHSGASAVFATAIRGHQGFHVTIRQAPEGLYAADPVLAATALNGAVETCIGAAVEQYLWSYKRYKRPPEGCPDPYG